MQFAGGNSNSILDRITDAVLALDNAGTVTYINRAAAQLFNSTAGSLLNQPLWNILTEYKKDPLYLACQQTLQQQQPVLLEFYNTHHSCWLDIHIYPSDDGLTVLMHDTTVRKEAALQLEQSEKRFRAIIDNNDGIISLVDEKLNVIFRNSAVAKAVGWNTDEYAAINGMENIHDEDSHHVNAALATALQLPGKAIPVLFRVKHKAGHYNWLEGVITNKADDPDIKGILTNLRDVTLRIEAEKKLQAEKQLLDRIINSLPGIFYMGDMTPKLLRWNKSFETISGYTAAELARMRPIELFDTRDHPGFKTAMAKALTEGSAQTEARMISKDGTSTPFYFTGVRIEYNGQTAMLGTGIDITEQKKAAREIRKGSERFSLSAKATNDMIWDWNLLTNEIWWNDNYIRLFSHNGVAPDQQISSWMNSIHPEDKERVIAGILGIINSGKKYWTDEYRYVRKDGTVFFIHDRGYVSHDENGTPYRMIGSMLDITERIKTEQILREKEERYRNLFERASDSIIVHNMKGAILDLNAASVGFSGYSKEELQRMNVTDLLFPEDLQQLPIPFDKLKAGETTFNRRRVKTKSAVIRIMEVSSKMLPDGNVMAMIRDVTERTEAERALRKSELRFRTLAGNAPVGIFETNTEGETTYVNEKMLEYTGLNFDELLQSNWTQCIHPEDLPSLISNWQQNLEQKKESSLQYRIINKDGTIRWVHGKAIPVYDKNGGYSGYLGTLSDITKEKLALIALAKSEEKYRTLVEQASDAIYIADTSGRLLTVNGSACRMSQYTEEELLQRSIYDFVFEEDLQKEPFRFEELQQGKTVVIQRRFKGKEGRILEVECIANLLSDNRILVFARDISERIKTQNEVIKEKNLSDSIINSLPGIFYLYDDTGRFIRWNKNFETISGYSGAEISTMQPLDFFDVPEKDLLQQKVEEVFRTGKADVEAFFFTKSKNKIPFYFNGWKLQYENQTCLIGVGIDISEKRAAEKLLLQSYDDIRRLASHLTQVREEERKRIGREIHDELGQQLTAVKMDVAWIDKKTEEENLAVKTKLKNIIALLDGSNKSVRRIITELSPGIIDNHGLLEALDRQNTQFTATTGIPVVLDTKEKTIHLSQPIANCIFRVYQESLTNIMRYADASKVVTSLKIEKDMVVVTIEDDGKGFDTSTARAKSSFGILGMKERVLSQNGTFHLHSKPGAGTKISITVPYKQ